MVRSDVLMPVHEAHSSSDHMHIYVCVHVRVYVCMYVCGALQHARKTPTCAHLPVIRRQCSTWISVLDQVRTRLKVMGYTATGCCCSI